MFRIGYLRCTVQVTESLERLCESRAPLGVEGVQHSVMQI